jgi:hypothetical protein
MDRDLLGHLPIVVSGARHSGFASAAAALASLPVWYLGDIPFVKLASATMNRILAAAADVEIRSPIGKLYRTR